MHNRRFVSYLLIIGAALSAALPLPAKSSDGIKLHLKKISHALSEASGQPIHYDTILKSADYIAKHLPAALANAVVTDGDHSGGNQANDSAGGTESPVSSETDAAKDHTGGELDSAVSDEPAPLQLSGAQDRALIKAYAVYSNALVQSARAGAAGSSHLMAAVAALKKYISDLDKLSSVEPGSAEFNETVKHLSEEASNFHG